MWGRRNIITTVTSANVRLTAAQQIVRVQRDRTSELQKCLNKRSIYVPPKCRLRHTHSFSTHLVPRGSIYCTACVYKLERDIYKLSCTLSSCTCETGAATRLEVKVVERSQIHTRARRPNLCISTTNRSQVTGVHLRY